MCKLIQDNRHEIEAYCKRRGLNAARVFSSPASFNSRMAYVQGVVKRHNSRGLLDETPAPVILRIYKEKNGKIRIEETENTMKFLRA